MSKGRVKAVQIRVTDEEYELIANKALALGLNISDYVRLVAIQANFNITVQPESNPKTRNNNED